MKPSGRAKLAGVMGDPVAQSLSPRLHGHWLEAYGIDGCYVPLAVARENFALALRGLRLAGFKGVNVTVPHKEAAFAVADRLDPAAAAAKAVNLLLFHADHIEGRNTDAAGLAASLVDGLGAEFLRGKPAVVLGAGGAARAALVALDGLGAREIRLVARNPARALQLAGELAAACTAQLKPLAWSGWDEAAGDAALILNATSAGMRGKAPLDLTLAAAAKDAAVCDVVYNPLETALLAEARARGHRVVDGLGMLMHQAVPAFAAFFGKEPAVTAALRRDLEGALRERD